MNPDLIRDAMRHQPAIERGVLTVSRNPWAPLEDVEPQRILRGMTIANAFAEFGVDMYAATPWIISVDGEWVSRKEWAVREIDPQSYVLIVALPQGGGGKSSQVIAGVILIIVGILINVFSAGSLSWLGTPMMKIGALMIVGSLLYKAPKPYTPDTASQLADPSPTYNLQAQGNYARIGQPVPVHYGRVPKFYPDFAAQPYAEYSGNDQFLYQLFVIGWGQFDFERIFIGDEELTGAVGDDGYWHSNGTWQDVSWEIVQPGGSVTLFPSRVISSDTVSGQEIVVGGVGPFQLTDAEVNSVAIDVIAPQGMYYANDAGGLDARSASWNVYATRLKQSGAAWVDDGNEFLLGSEAISAATNTPIRNTYRYAVALGRYKFRLVRTNAKDTDTRANNAIDWYGLRGYCPGVQQYGNVTLLAMRMRATDQLTSATSRSINVTATRKLYTWSLAGGWSSQPVATRSIAWAWADALTSEDYGCGATDDRIPLAQLATLGAAWEAAGFYCDYRFDRQVTCAEALTLIARTGNAQWYTQGDQYKIWRAQKAGIPVQLYNMRNIRRGSFELDWTLPNSTSPDCYDVWYFDSESAQTAQVRCALVDGTQLRPTRIDLDGVTSRAQAWAIGMQMLRSARWHRKNGILKTECEGYLAAPGKTIAISHDVLLTATSAELIAFSGTGKASGDVLALSESLEWTAGVNHYIELATRTGGYSGPWHVTQGAADNQVVLAEPIADDAYTPYVGTKAERTRCNFGPSENISVKALVVPPIEYGEKDEITLHWVVEDDRAYADDGSTIPTNPNGYDLSILVRPVVEGLVVVWSGTPSVPTLDLSWQPAAGATRYIIEISTDNTTWTRLADATTASARIACTLAPTWVRVAAVGTLRGDWTVWNGNPATMQSIPANVTGLALLNAVAGSPTVYADMTAILTWNTAARADGYVVDVYRAGSKIATHLRSETRLEYTAEINRADNGGSLVRALTFRVRGLNGAGYSASPAEISINNPQMAAATVQGQQSGSGAILLTVNRPAASDYAGTRFVISQNASLDPSTAALAADVADWAATVPYGNAGRWYFWAANYDQFGTDALNWSPRGECVVTDTVSGIQTVNDASTITGTIGGPPPGGEAYWAVVSAADGKIWRWISSQGKYTAAVDGADLVANSVAANKIAVATLSAISAALGTITSAIMTFTGAQWNYIRTQFASGGKWLADGLDGWIIAAQGSTGDYFQEFRASSGSSLILERKSNGPNVGLRYLTQIIDASGTERFVMDPVNGRYVMRGTIYAEAGQFSGTLAAPSGTFGDISAGWLHNPSGTAILNLNAGTTDGVLYFGGQWRILADGRTYFNNTLYDNTFYINDAEGDVDAAAWHTSESRDFDTGIVLSNDDAMRITVVPHVSGFTAHDHHNNWWIDENGGGTYEYLGFIVTPKIVSNDGSWRLFINVQPSTGLKNGWIEEPNTFITRLRVTAQYLR